MLGRSASIRLACALVLPPAFASACDAAMADGEGSALDRLDGDGGCIEAQCCFPGECD